MPIRHPTTDDIPMLCELSTQLGYDVTPAQMQQRLGPYLTRQDHVVYVADDGGVVGFINGMLRRDLCYEDQVELMSLVVADHARGRGVGKALVAKLEEWARAQGATYLRLGSRETRKDAHRFYLREGFELEKVHHILRKRLD